MPYGGVAIGAGLSGFAQGFAQVFTEKKKQEQEEKLRQKHDMQHFILDQAAKGNVPIDHPEVQSQFKAVFGKDSDAATKVYEAIAGHNYTIKQAWPQWKAAHGGDPVTAYEAWHALPEDKRDPMVLESLQGSKTDLGVILERSKARESALGKGEAEAQQGSPWQQHLAKNNFNLTQAYETAPSDMVKPKGVDTEYNRLKNEWQLAYLRGKGGNYAKLEDAPAMAQADAQKAFQMEQARHRAAAPFIGPETTTRTQARLEAEKPYKLDEAIQKETLYQQHRLEKFSDKLAGNAGDPIPQNILDNTVILDRNTKKRVRTAGMTKGIWRTLQSAKAADGKPQFLFVSPTFAQRRFPDWALSDKAVSAFGAKPSENLPQADDESSLLRDHGIQP